MSKSFSNVFSNHGPTSQAMYQTQISSFMAGTLIDTFTTAASKSGTKIAINYLFLLTPAQQYDILDNAEYLAGWRCRQEARILLSTLGGLPRFIEEFIMAVVAAQLNGLTFEDISWSNVVAKVKNCHVAKCLYWNRTPELARPLVDAIMLRERVQSAWPVFHGRPDTYQSLQQNAQIVLQVDPSDEHIFIPTMPFLAFRVLVENARRQEGAEDKDHNRFNHLYLLMEDSPDQWQSFQRFAIKHTAVMNEFFANAQRPEASFLSRRYASGYGDAKDIKINFLTA